MNKIQIMRDFEFVLTNNAIKLEDVILMIKYRTKSRVFTFINCNLPTAISDIEVHLMNKKNKYYIGRSIIKNSSAIITISMMIFGTIETVALC